MATWAAIYGSPWFVSGVFAVSLLLRLALIAYGDWQDNHFEVKFTDVDYNVFTDAAEFVAQGQSPYLRATFRYTPLLAWVLVPNITVHRVWGKLLFGACDLGAGYLLYRLLRLKGLAPNAACSYSCLWLLNPMVATVSTRGSAESLIAISVLSTLYAVQTRHYTTSGLLLGLAIHLKLYPLVYSWPLYLSLPDPPGPPSAINRLWPTRTRVQCAVVTAGSLFALTYAMWYMYGTDFVDEALLYHVRRRDNRHNFSPYFYLLYLTLDTKYSHLLGLLAFLPQVILLLAIGWAYGRQLELAMFAQTVAFVAFNKVCTSQYFLWYLCLLPLVLPDVISRLPLTKLAGPVAAWAAAQGLWLARAYALEFLGQAVFLEIWAAGLLFLAAHAWLLTTILEAGGKKEKTA